MRVLMLVNGLGLGNATRCHAVCRALQRGGADITVMTSGNGHWYFTGLDQGPTVHGLPQTPYGQSDDGALSMWRTFTSVGAILGAIVEADRAVGRLIDELAPDVVVIDSMYGVYSVLRRGVPIVAINNSDVVVASMARLGAAPRSVWGQYHLVEKNDLRFHRWVPTAVASPSLVMDLPVAAPHFRRIGPIVREGLARDTGLRAVKRVLLMLSGSQFGRVPVLPTLPEGVHLDVVGAPERPDAVPDGVTWHGRMLDNRSLIRQADVAIVNGGFSAVSELFHLGTPLLVLPVPNHAEQWVNGATIEQLGVGLSGTEHTLQRDLDALIERADAFREAHARLDEPEDGAAQAAALVAEVAGA